MCLVLGQIESNLGRLDRFQRLDEFNQFWLITEIELEIVLIQIVPNNLG